MSGNGKSEDGRTKFSSGNIEIQLESLEDESWVSTDLKNKVIVTSSEEQMQAMLKNGGKIAGSRSHDSALVVLTAEKTLLQAGMNSDALGDDDDGDSGWDSNILRNTKQVAFLVTGDLSAQLAAKDLAAVPAPARDLILIGGKAYGLVRIDPVMSGAEVALYRLHLRA